MIIRQWFGRWRRIAGIGLLWLLMLTLAATMACAQVSVSPTVLVLGDDARTRAITVENTGTANQVFRVSLINLKMLPDGQMVPAAHSDESQHFAANKVRYAPREVVLAPGASAIVRFELPASLVLPAGEYRTHILVQQVPSTDALEAPPFHYADGVAVNLRAVFGVAVPLIIRRGDLPAAAAIKDVRLARLADGSAAVALRLERSGARSIRGDLTLSIDGEEVESYGGIAVYAPASYRDLSLPLSNESHIDLSAHRIEARFREPEDDPSAIEVRAIVPSK